jgi:hypothetical protein
LVSSPKRNPYLGGRWGGIGASELKRNEKENFTVVAAGAAASGKLPLEFIASGKTIRVERIQIGQVDGYWWSHSLNGWQTPETFHNYLVNL